jgi:hypothetical protein
MTGHSLALTRLRLDDGLQPLALTRLHLDDGPLPSLVPPNVSMTGHCLVSSRLTPR